MVASSGYIEQAIMRSISSAALFTNKNLSWGRETKAFFIYKSDVTHRIGED